MLEERLEDESNIFVLTISKRLADGYIAKILAVFKNIR
jgi:hypothetical protein